MTNNWQAIVQADFALPDSSNIMVLTDELLRYLSSPDPKLRAEIAYPVFIHWIGRGFYSPEQLRDLMDALTANLFATLGENGMDSVFGRSFSALVLTLIIHYDNQNRFLKHHEVTNLLKRTLNYFIDENDWRGYIQGKGWAHSVAHTSDLLMVLSQSRHMDGNYLAHILYGIADKVKYQTGYLLVHEEDERLAQTVMACLPHAEITENILGAFVNRLTQLFEHDSANLDYDAKFHSAYFNTKNFIRSLYFQLHFQETPLPHSDFLKTQLLEALEAFPH